MQHLGQHSLLERVTANALWRRLESQEGAAWTGRRWFESSRPTTFRSGVSPRQHRQPCRFSGSAAGPLLQRAEPVVTCPELWNRLEAITPLWIAPSAQIRRSVYWEQYECLRKNADE